jgi:hypothetical protein
VGATARDGRSTKRLLTADEVAEIIGMRVDYV